MGKAKPKNSFGDKLEQVGGFASAYEWKKSDPAWIPEIDDKLKARFDRLKQDLRIEFQAYEDAAANTPATADTELNSTQQTVRDHCVHKIGMLFEFLSSQLGLALQNMTSEVGKLDFNEEARKAEADFEMALAGDVAVAEASERLVKAETGLKYFAARHQRVTPASYPESPLLFWAVLVGLLVVESVANGIILQEVSPGGFTGGIILAMGISLVNVGGGVIGGAVGWRLLSHRFVFPRIIGIVVTLGTLAGAIFWNFLVAHYRQLAEEAILTQPQDSSSFDPFATPDAAATGASGEGSAGTADTNLFGSALNHMQTEGWLALDTIWAWLLLAAGLIIFLLACREGWDDLADRYWDYRKYDRKQRAAQESFEDECDRATSTAAAKLDDAVARSRRAAAAIEANCVRSEAIADLAEQRFVEVLDSETHWVRECNRLLQYYRECNDKVRHASFPPPGYWQTYPTPEEYRLLLARDEGGGSKALELASSQLEQIRVRRGALAEIVAHNRTAVADMEAKVTNLKASISDRAKTLRKEAKARAELHMREFLHRPPPGESEPRAGASFP